MNKLDRDWERIARVLYKKGIISLCGHALVAKRVITAPLGRVDPSLTYEHHHIAENIRFDYFKPQHQSNTPALLICPGSAYVYPPQRSHHAWAQYLCKRLGWPVFLIHHRLSPKHAFPVPYEDCLDTIRWIAQQATKFNVLPNQFVLIGESSGASTAAALCHAFKATSENFIQHQVLIYPTCDPDSLSDDAKFRDDFLVEKLNRAQMLAVYHQHYAPKDRTDPRAWPLQFQSFENLPSATIILAEVDRFYDEGLRYASCLSNDGVSVTVSSYDGVTHGFISFVPHVRKAIKANHWLVNHLKKCLLGGVDKSAYSSELV